MALVAISPNKRSLLLYVVLAVTVGLTAWTAMRDGRGETSTDVAEASQSRRPVQAILAKKKMMTQTMAADRQGFSLPRRDFVKQPVHDLFKVHSWFVPPPVKKIPPSSPPVAPPVPFAYMGKLENSPKGTLIFLLANNQLYSVTRGESVTPQWRLDMENENMLRFTYLPLGLPAVLLKSAPAITATRVRALVSGAQNYQYTD